MYLIVACRVPAMAGSDSRRGESLCLRRGERGRVRRFKSGAAKPMTVSWHSDDH
jgi:hypothetical protein